MRSRTEATGGAEDKVSEINQWKITIDTRRGGYLESFSRVRAVVVDVTGRVVMQAGDCEEPVLRISDCGIKRNGDAAGK